MRQALQKELANPDAAPPPDNDPTPSDAAAPAPPPTVPLVSDCQAADMAALAPSELLGMATWAAACARGRQTQRALAAAAQYDASLAQDAGDARGGRPPKASREAGGADRETVAPQHLGHLLRHLHGCMLSGSLDGDWMQETHPHWRASLRGIMVNAQVQRLAAEAQEKLAAGEEKAEGQAAGGEQAEGEQAEGEQAEEAGAAGGGEDVVRPRLDEEGVCTVSKGSVEALLANAAAWCVKQRCVTAGTMSLLRQVRGLRWLCMGGWGEGRVVCARGVGVAGVGGWVGGGAWGGWGEGDWASGRGMGLLHEMVDARGFGKLWGV